MFLTYLMLAVALCLSAVAAFYSIIGLTAIFAAAVWPIVIMGSILEAAKLVVTVWLHEYWRDVKVSMKIYLVPAVFTLMVITSMGIFGFLSKAHLDQTVPTGDVQAQVALIDEKINNERDTIANARTLLAQLDKAVTDISNSADQEIKLRDGTTQIRSSAERALQVRRQQARDRAALTRTIEESQARIVKLQEEKAPFAKDLRKIEAEVGPIKYIAALIYGDNPDANLLEKAVRWVIIILVVVFDPLAIMMLLAATESYRWERQKRQSLIEDNNDTGQPTEEDKNGTIPDDASISQDLDGHPTGSAVDLEPVVEVVGQPTDREEELKTDQPAEPQIVDETPKEESLEPTHTIEKVKNTDPDKDGVWNHEERTPDGIISFGPVYPRYPSRGDLFVKINNLPTTLYKYNGEKWMEVDKTLTDHYAYNQQYIDYLITKVSSGEYDPELLTEAERSQIEDKLKKDFS